MVEAVATVVLFAWAAIALIGMLLTPTALVWPRAHAHLMIPRPLRPRVVSRPRLWSVVVAAPPAVGMALMAGAGMVEGPGPGRSVSAYLVGLALAVLIFGGSVAASLSRAVLIGAREWAITLMPATVVVPPTAATRSVPAQRPGDASPALERPRAQLLDRRLRGSARWLGAAGLGWYLLGRAVQLGSARSDAPAWWWVGTASLLLAGLAVWTARRTRRPRGVRATAAEHLTRVRHVLVPHGLTVRAPAGDWVRVAAPAAFLPADVVIGPSLWPWVATGQVGGHEVLVATQRGQVRRRTGLTTATVRTACSARVPGADLPGVVVTGREGVPPTELHRAVKLELEQFNRELWVWGPDPRGVYDMLHPRAMARALTSLPDGCTLVVGGERVAVFTDEPAQPDQLPALVGFVVTMADLVPSYLRTS